MLTRTHIRPAYVVTPDAAARGFANTNPNFTGVLKVISLTPAGRGGTTIKRKTTTFFVSNGVSVKNRIIHQRSLRGNDFTYYRNGVCPVCGNVSLACEILPVFDDAGHSLDACPTCRRQSFTFDSHRYHDHTGGVYLSTHATHSIYRVDATVNICDMQFDQTRPPVIQFTQPVNVEAAHV